MVTLIDTIADRVISSARNHPSCVSDDYPDAWCDLVDQVRNGDYDIMGGDYWRWLRSIICDQVSSLSTEEFNLLRSHLRVHDRYSHAKAESKGHHDQSVSSNDFNRIIDLVESKVVGTAYSEELEQAIGCGRKKH